MRQTPFRSRAPANDANRVPRRQKEPDRFHLFPVRRPVFSAIAAKLENVRRLMDGIGRGVKAL
jgi:hypothetical protein